MSISIRLICSEDKALWQSLFEQYLDFYETSRSQSIIDRVFARMISGDSGEFRGFVAEIDGVIAGFTHFLSHRKMWDIENAFYLQDLFVASSARGQGAARALIEEVYAIADAEGTPKVYWLTQESNHTAQALYNRLAKRSEFIHYTR